MLVILFVASLCLVVHAYFGYPATLWLIGMFRRKEIRKREYLPPVTLIITVCNEEKRIGSKIENTLVVEYPKDKLQILVASDGSTDQTNEIVSAYAQAGFELLALPVRKGKEYAQAEAVRKARGEILVFTDVATMLEPTGVMRIVANFADPTVGCVSSEDRVVGADGKPCGEGFYVRYEMWLRRLETRANSLIGLSGSFFAARKEACADLSGDMQSDFRTLLTSVRMGWRGVCDPGVLGYYRDISDRKREFDRKVRTVIRGLTVYFQHLEFLDVSRYGLFSYQYLCHKLLRWLVPLFLGIALVTNGLLASQSLPLCVLFLAQLSFYGLGIWGWRRAGEKASTNFLLKIPAYFLTVNSSIAVAWWRYLRRDRIVMWNPSER